MNIPSEYKKQILTLSDRNRQRVLSVVKRLKDAYEITAVSRPVTFSPVYSIDTENSYDESDILGKLEEWEILTADKTEDFDYFLVDIDGEKLIELLSLLELHSFGDEVEKFKFHSTIDLKREVLFCKIILSQIPYSNGNMLRFRYSDFINKITEGEIYAVLDKISNILQRFERVGLIFDYEAGEPAMQHTVVTFIANTSSLEKYLLALQEEISLRENGSTGKDSTHKPWPSDFGWTGKKYVFGKIGSLVLESKTKRALLKCITDKKGVWTTMKEMRDATEKDDNYIRATIGDIRGKLPKGVTIISTKEVGENENKPREGAYKIIVN